MSRLFGTDGIRGRANVYPMDAMTAYKLGVAVAHLLKQDTKTPKVLIGRDTRRSGAMLEGAILAGICAAGAEAVLVGVIPTPGVAYLTRTTHCQAGIVISASHNPFVDNGIKIFAHDGYKLPDAREDEIAALVQNGAIDKLTEEPHLVGQARVFKGAKERYIEALLESFPRGMDLDGLSVVLDCAHGAAVQTAPEVFRRLNAELHLIGIAPDGTNINRGYGSLHPEQLALVVKEKGADLGVAFDGDADRAIFIDHEGNEVDGDTIMAICAQDLKERRLLKGNTLVATVMSNIGLALAMERLGINLERTQVGDRYVVERMLQQDFTFGGEQSGHLIFRNHSTTGDGVLAALQVLAIVRQRGKTLQELGRVMTKSPQVLKNLTVSYKPPLDMLELSQKAIRQTEEALGKEGRVLVRYSGTENKVRVMVEGPDEATIHQHVDRIIRALDSELN